ncbi:hypothetical protein REC12_25485 [Desulfosporosinus sp. PR]|nr:hypothetical protein [Desulfosporosinus sp. PR]MDQ7096952.1 hypothetical protein [Desulfosporosinus sp. PR]
MMYLVATSRSQSIFEVTPEMAKEDEDARDTCAAREKEEETSGQM